MINILILTILATLFYLIPVVIGRACLQLTMLRKKIEHWSYFPGYFAIGTSLIFCLALLINYLILPFIKTSTLNFSQIFFPATYGFALLSLPINIWKGKKLHHVFDRHSLLVMGTTALLSLTAYGIWLWHSPYSLNWDLYEHQTLVQLISQGHFSYFTSQISDTFGFNSYPPVFHLLMSLSQFPLTLSPEQILQYWNVIGFFHLWMVSLVSYAFAFAITKRKSLSLLSCILGTLTFESVIAFTSFFLLPQTLAAVLFIGLFANIVWRKINHHPLLSIEVLLGLLLLPFLHYVIGGFALIILLATLMYFRFQDQFELLSAKFPITEILGLVIIASLFGSQFLQLSSLNHGEAASYIFTIKEKITFMTQAYGYLLLFCVPLGILATIRQSNWIKKYLLLILVGFMAVLVAPLPYVIKFMVLGRWFILFFAALGLWSLIDKQTYYVYRWLSFAVITIGLSGVLILNSLLWKQGLSTDQQISHVSQDELAAANYLHSISANQPVLIISDPATQYLLEGLSGANSAGGSFANVPTRTALAYAFSTTNSAQIKANLLQIHDPVATTPTSTYVIFSGRLFLWQQAAIADRNSFDFNIWSTHPLTLNDTDWLNQLDQNTFPMVYQNATLQIRKIR